MPRDHTKPHIWAYRGHAIYASPRHTGDYGWAVRVTVVEHAAEIGRRAQILRDLDEPRFATQAQALEAAEQAAYDFIDARLAKR